MSLPVTPPDASPGHCPLCGEPNACAMERARATGEAQPPCWCTNARFSAELLARVPQPAQGRACICTACVRASQT